MILLISFLLLLSFLFSLIFLQYVYRMVAFAGAEKYVYSMMLMDANDGVMTAGNREGVSQSLQDQLKPLAVALWNRSTGWPR
ncbi:hypothetical protein NSS79_14045 [Paenibacillus sp. FSL L8-0436]|uniref:hypothetical protein n=1 Tax=Paenibacillus sp. FSL L8-0436 TaxID=2954686 RepID=UPI0031595E71